MSLLVATGRTAGRTCKLLEQKGVETWLVVVVVVVYSHVRVSGDLNMHEVCYERGKCH